MKNIGCSCIVVLTLIICTICSASGVQANSIDILASGIQPSALQPQVFVEPTDGYKPVLDALNSAQSSIFVEMYLMTDKNIIDALRNAASRGVNVRVMLEKNAYDNPADLQAIMDSLNSSGISVETSSPAFYLTHEKAIVIDRRIAIIMTLNQDHTAYTKNREFGLIDCNTTDAAEIAATFEADWNRTVPELSDPNLVWSPVNSRDRILSLIDGAEQSLEIENEEMQDQEVEDHLISAAQRGVNVRVVMSPSSSMTDANAPGRDGIIKGGVLVRLINVPYIHAKLIIADGLKAFIGSENFSPTSLNDNRELGILINDSGIIQTLSSTFDADWNSGSDTNLNSGSDTNLNSGIQIQKNYVKQSSPKKPKIPKGHNTKLKPSIK